jgi:hypothetical protein
MESGTATLPMSCSSAAAATRSTSSPSRPRRRATAPASATTFSACSPVPRSRSDRARARAPIAPRGADAAASGDAGALEDRGGVGQQAVELGGAAVDGDARRDGDGPLLLEDRDEALGDAAGAGEVGAGHDHRELVGAGASDDVAAAHELAQPGADRGQGRVAGGGAAAAVERAEAVDVHEDGGGRLAAALRATQRGGRGLPEGVVRQDAGAAVLAQVVGALGLQRGDARVRGAQLVTEPAGLGEHPARFGARADGLVRHGASVDTSSSARDPSSPTAAGGEEPCAAPRAGRHPKRAAECSPL